MVGRRPVKSIMITSAAIASGGSLDFISDRCGRQLKLTREELKNLILKYETHCTTVPFKFLNEPLESDKGKQSQKP